MNKKIAITGSSGFVGYVLSKYFSEKGIDVVGLDVSKNHAWMGNSKFRFINCDVTDKSNVNKIFKEEKPTHVIHLAYLMSSIYDEKKEYDIDVNGTKNVFYASEKTKSVVQFIEFSSTSAYGAWPDCERRLKETEPLRPRDYRYGVNKKIIEEFLNKQEKRKSLKLVIVRMCTAIGPLYHKPGGVVKLLANSPVLLKLNNRYCELQFIHEEDLRNLIELIVNDNKAEGTFNLTPNDYATTKQLAPNKPFIIMPLFVLRFFVRMLWNLRLYSRLPGAMDLTTYGIIADSQKIIKRYDYKFKYGTSSGFFDTVAKRRKLKTL